jgi:hypothetical protein
LQILWVLHFIAATIEKQGLGDNWLINVHKNFILYWKQLAIISQTYETLLSAKNDKKKKSDFFANSFDLHFIAATIEKQQDLGQLTNKCSQKLYFIENSLPLFPRPMKTLLAIWQS